jgi:hypothetical protein
MVGTGVGLEPVVKDLLGSLESISTTPTPVRRSRIEQLVSEELRKDESKQASLPILERDYELVQEGPNRYTEVFLAERMWRGPDVTVFATQSSQTVVKYQTDSRYIMGEKIHPLVREFVILKHIEPLKISLQAYFLSRPVIWSPLVVSKKTDFDLDPEDRHPNSKVRYMIMERGEMTLFQYMKLLDLNEDKAFRFRSALKAGVQLLKHLRVLHDAGIVHGDIHLANVVLNHNGEVKLIDFGLAFFAEEMDNTPDRINNPMSWNHCYLSHWNIEGFRFGFRDDVFKTIMIVANLMNGYEYFEKLCKTQPGPSAQEAFEFRKSKFIFGGVEGEEDIVAKVFPHWSAELRADVDARLRNALATARAPETVRDKAEIDSIIADFDFIYQAIVKNPTTGEVG